MSGIPVVVSNNGRGLPVKQVNSGAPVMTVATNGRGIPIILSNRGIPFVVQGLGPPTLATLTLSGTLRNGVPSSGSIIGATTGSTIVSNVSGLTVNSGARTYTFDGSGAAGTTANGLVETLAGAVGSPKNNSITVAAAYVLGTLTLSGTLTNGTASSGTINGATTGSTITSNVTGLTVNSGARTYSFDGSAAAGTTSNGLVETLTGATGSPKNSSVTVAAAAGAADLMPTTVTIGDSWYGNAQPPYTGFYMGQYFAAHTNHLVVNLAKGGTGLDWISTQRGAAAAEKPYVIILSFGRNDFMGGAYGGATDAQKYDAFVAYYLARINDLKNDTPGTLIVVETLTEQHASPDTTYQVTYNAYRKTLNTQIRQWKTDGVIAEYIDIGAEPTIGADGHMIPGSPETADGTHLNEGPSGHGKAYAVFDPTMDGFYTAHAAPGIATAPVLSNLSSGWTSGDNPPNWDTTYSGVYYSSGDGTGDQLRLLWRLGGTGSYTTTAWTPFDINYLTDGFTYAFLTDGTLNAGGLFEVFVEVGRNFVGGVPLVTAQSNKWSDTLNAAAVPKWSYNAAPPVQVFVFGDPTTTTFANEAFGVGTAVARVAYQGRTPSAVTIGGVSATKLIDSVDGNNGVAIWVAASAAAGNKNVVLTTAGAVAWQVCIATGTLSSAINPSPTATPTLPFGFGADPQTSPTFTLPANGVAVAIAGVFGNGVTPTWGSGTANAERHGANGEFQFGAGSLLGGGSSSSTNFQVSGFNFSGSEMAVAVFGP